MKLQHFAIIFLIIILPFSIICRNTMASYSMVLKDQVRLNNTIDAATQDALDMLIELNDEFQMLYFNERFDITQQLAEQSVKSFFQTMSINFNMPYIDGQTEAYFSMYIPAIVIVAYDGFFIYSVDENTDGTYTYQMSPKIPYAYFDAKTGTLVHFTLGNYVRLFTRDKMYEGELTCDLRTVPDASGDLSGSRDKYMEFCSGFGIDYDTMTTAQKLELLNYIPDLTSDMSIIIQALYEYNHSLVPDFLIPPRAEDADFNITSLTLTDTNSGDIPLLRDYDGESDLEASNFHRIRRETIINLITSTLKEEINEHTSYASMYGSTYQFGLPDVARDDWMNSINDISVMSFIQGIPVGVNMFYDNYALSGSRIVQTDYYYGTNPTPDSAAVGDEYYHRESCPRIQDFIVSGDTDSTGVDNIFITREQAAENGYYPCDLCHP